MATKPKIKIVDDENLRKEIDLLYEATNQVLLAKWSISVAKHVLNIMHIDFKTIDVIHEGFRVNEEWQIGTVRMHDVRQSGFKVHRLARETKDKIKKMAYRTVGQAISSGHMREHAMVASDYAVKVIGMLSSNDPDEITKERVWQLEELIRIIDSH